MDLSKLDPASLEFSAEEMDALALVLSKAEQIKKDTTLLRLVQKHAEKKVSEFKSVDDLKKHAKRLEKDMDDKNKTDEEDEDEAKQSEEAK